MGDEKMVGQAVKAMVGKEGKYLTFTLAEEAYGIGILKIKEIIGNADHVRAADTGVCERSD